VSRVRRTVALAAVLLAALPAGAGAFSKAIWGPVYYNGANQFPIYRELGASIYSAFLYWYQVAPTRPAHPENPADPAYKWPVEIDQAVQQAALFHMRVNLEVIGAPRWSNGDHSWNWTPKRADYAAFLVAATRRYPTVHLWEIWGEPNRSPNYMPQRTVKPGRPLDRAQQVAPHNYAKLLAAAYAALKRASPKNLVIGGNTFTGGTIRTRQWIENLRLPDGKPPPMDLYGHNPFSYTPPSFTARRSPAGEVQFKDLPRLADWIDKYLGRPIPIYISEWNIPTAPDEEFPWWVAPDTAAQWVRTALKLCRGWRRIYALGWNPLIDFPPISTSGLVSADGTPKPTFYAFEQG
jgi:hypothetical protein